MCVVCLCVCVLQELHIIIFDEIDAICRQRGSVRDGTGTHDTIVNQLLTKIDGVDALNNILLIGMTNRCVQRAGLCSSVACFHGCVLPSSQHATQQPKAGCVGCHH